jgi:hypothetical protein
MKRTYVKELLHMNIVDSREISKVSVNNDELEAHLRALESLGVSADQMDIILFQWWRVVYLKTVTWQISSNYGREDKNADPPMTEFESSLNKKLRKRIEEGWDGRDFELLKRTETLSEEKEKK